MNFKGQLQALLNEAHKYQYADICDTAQEIKRKKPKLYFTPIQWGLVLLSAIIALTTKGFSENFVGYIVAGLSLFAGLFFSFILMLIDKFQKIDFEPYKQSNNAGIMPFGVRLKNYYKKATTLSFYIVLLSLLSVVLLSLSLLDISIPSLISLDEDATISQFLRDIKTYFSVLYRGVTVYILLNFLWITLYLTTSFYDYISSEYDKVKLK